MEQGWIKWDWNLLKGKGNWEFHLKRKWRIGIEKPELTPNPSLDQHTTVPFEKQCKLHCETPGHHIEL